MIDGLTILRSRGRVRLAKLVLPDGGIEDYDQARTFDVFSEPVGDLGDVETVLRRLLPRWNCAAIRGAPLDPARIAGVRRLLYVDPKTGEAPAFAAAARYWLALDIDALPVPAGLDLSDLAACGKLARAALPAAFHGVSFIVQATGSHALRGLHLRLWFWLTRAVADHEARVWFKGCPVDPSVFNSVQLIYTAAPLLAAGIADPLPERLAVVFGAADVVAVPEPAALSPPPRHFRPPPAPDHVRASGYAATALAQIAARILGAQPGGRHKTIVIGARRCAELEAAGLVAASESDALLTRAARGAGLERDGRDLADEIGRILAWARRGAVTEGDTP